MGIFVYFLLVVFWGCVWGFAVRAVIVNKGYYDESAKWFWLGFFFAFFALAVAFSKPQCIYEEDYYKSLSPQEQQQKVLDSGGWKCLCGAVNASYISTCKCGRTKRDVLSSQQEEKQGDKSSENIDQLLKYKQLLDAGGIAQEEFDRKKKELLNS